MPICFTGRGRLTEALRLRVKDLDFAYQQIIVRDGKGGKDRATVLPKKLIEPLKRQLIVAQKIHERDLALGFGRVEMPFALERKYPNAEREWMWQYIFPVKIYEQKSAHRRDRTTSSKRSEFTKTFSAGGH